jgi:hypothetical protein
VIRLRRAANITQPAWTVYKNSLLYLALLFSAMMVDGFVPGARVGQPAPLLLNGPDVTASAAVPAIDVEPLAR